MSVVLQESRASWWAAHLDQLQDWSTIKVVLLYQFIPPNEICSRILAYDGRTFSQEHVEHCCSIW